MSSQNLLKSIYVSIDSSQVRVIDSNDRIAHKIGSDAFVQSQEQSEAEPYVLDSFSEDGTEDNVARLFDEEPTQEGELSQASIDTASQEMAQQILEDANAQAQQIIEQAKESAQQQTMDAYQDARQQGMQEGYQEGLQKAQDELEAQKAQLTQQQRQLQADYEERLEEMEPYLIEQLTGIYEHVFGVDLSEHRSVLAHLIANTLHSVENVSSYLVHVSSQDYSYVSMQKPQIIEEGCTGKASVEIIEDMTLSKNECLIETENGIFDCSLSVQLGELKRKLKLLSYRGNKE